MKKIILVLITMLTFTVSQATIINKTVNAAAPTGTTLINIPCQAGDTILFNVFNADSTMNFMLNFGTQGATYALVNGDHVFLVVVGVNDIGGYWMIYDAANNFTMMASGTINQTTTGINELSKLNVSVYPNPTSDYINVKLDEPVKNISLYDLSGKLVLTASDVNQVDVSNLSKGSYSLRVTTDKSTAIKNVILN